MAGAWISVAGLYGNIVFKNYMTEDVEESFPLSLYYAISKQQQWKMFVTFSEIDATWNALAFDDSTWQTVVPATITAQQTGTQYYRKQFSGVEDHGCPTRSRSTTATASSSTSTARRSSATRCPSPAP